MNKEQQLSMDISNYKSKVRKAIISNPGIVETYLSRIKELETQLAGLKNNTPKTKYIAPKVASIVLRYKEVEINGEIFLECTSCSADKGNCSCWSC